MELTSTDNESLLKRLTCNTRYVNKLVEERCERIESYFTITCAVSAVSSECVITGAVEITVRIYTRGISVAVMTSD